MIDGKEDGRSFQSVSEGNSFVDEGHREPLGLPVSDEPASPPGSNEASEEALILTALADERFRTRTVGGIAAQTHLGEDRIRALIRESPLLSREVKLFPFRSTEGKVLLTTRERFDATSTFAERFVDAFASKRGDLDAS